MARPVYLPRGRSRLHKFSQFPPTLDLQRPTHLLCTLFSNTAPSSPSLSQRLRILDKHRGFAAIPSSAKALGVRCLLNVLHISTTTVQLGSSTLSSFTHLLLTLDSSGVLPTFVIDYDPLLFEALRTAVDSAHDSGLCTRLWTLHTTLDSAHDSRLCTRLWTLHTTLHTTVDSSHTRRPMNSIDIVSPGCVDTVIGVSAFSRIATLHSKQPRSRSNTSNTEQ